MMSATRKVKRGCLKKSPPPARVVFEPTVFGQTLLNVALITFRCGIKANIPQSYRRTGIKKNVIQGKRSLQRHHPRVTRNPESENPKTNKQ